MQATFIIRQPGANEALAEKDNGQNGCQSHRFNPRDPEQSWREIGAQVNIPLKVWDTP